MDAREALLEALHADPADGVAWLALADWLEENGEPPRAELIRLQRSLPALPPGRKRYGTEERIQKLLADGVLPCVPTRTNSLGMEFALIPAGTFRMGSPTREQDRMEDEVLHPVRITRPFYLGVHPVTQGQFKALMRNNPSRFQRPRVRARSVDPDRFPVDQATWTEAETFCSLLSRRREEKQAGRSYRLPTEAEWEYACRAWGSPRYPFHYGMTLERPQANFRSEDPYPDDSPLAAPARSLKRTCEVGRYAPNAFGLYDMHGNVDEWVSDWYDEDYYTTGPEADPPGPAGGDRRVVRGGSCYAQGADCRAAVRIGYGVDYRSDRIGFRVVMEAGRG